MSAFVSKANLALLGASGSALFGKARIERTKIDHDSLVGSATDLFCAIACGYFETNSFSIDFDHLGRRGHVATDRGSCEMSYIYRRADRALICIQEWPDSIESGIFHGQNHHRRRQHLRQYGVLESVGKMLRLYTQRERSL